MTMTLLDLSGPLGSAYGFMQGAWPFGVVELVWAEVVGWRWWKQKPRSSLGRPQAWGGGGGPPQSGGGGGSAGF